jgi:DNA-binding MarR family transcriptional regulator
VSRQDRPEPDVTALADRLHSTAIRILRRVRPVDAESGLTAPRLSLLSVLVFRGPATISELAEAEQVKPPTVSRMVKDMQWGGLVERQADPDDGRVRRVTATERGRSLLLEGRRRRVAALARDLAGLDPPDRDVLDRAVAILAPLTGVEPD